MRVTDKATVHGVEGVLKLLGRICGTTPLNNAFQSIETENFISRAFGWGKSGLKNTALGEINKYLTLRTYAVGYGETTADFALWSVLTKGKKSFNT
eukprot:UN27776